MEMERRIQKEIQISLVSHIKLLLWSLIGLCFFQYAPTDDALKTAQHASLQIRSARWIADGSACLLCNCRSDGQFRAFLICRRQKRRTTKDRTSLSSLCRSTTNGHARRSTKTRSACLYTLVSWTTETARESNFWMRKGALSGCQTMFSQGIKYNSRCALDKYLLTNLEYPTDLMAGREAHVYKYADRDNMYFDCQISITVKEPGLDYCDVKKKEKTQERLNNRYHLARIHQEDEDLMHSHHRRRT